MIGAFTEDVRHELIFANYAPVVFISALKRRGIDELLTTIIEISEQHAMRIPTSELNRLIADATFDHPTTRRGTATENLLRHPGSGETAHLRTLRQRPGTGALLHRTLPGK